MVEVIRGGQTMTVQDIIPGDIPIGAGGGAPSVSVSGSTVTVGGKGFTVRPDLQEKFIRERGGRITTQVRHQIELAQRQELQRLASQRRSSAIQAQRDAAQKRAEGIAREKEFITKLRGMKAQERARFIREQRQIQIALNVTKLREQGKRLDPTSQKAFNKFQRDQASQLRTQGVKPIFSRGVLVGGEVEGKSFSLTELEKGVTVTVRGVGDLNVKEENTIKNFLSTQPKILSEIRELPENQRGKELAKFLFLGGFTGISKKLEKGGLPSRIASKFFPTTPAEVALFGGVGVLTAGLGGRLLQLLTSGVITTLGLGAAVAKESTTEERIAGGLVALAGTIPAGSLGLARIPFIKIKKVVKRKRDRIKREAIPKTPLEKTFPREVKFKIDDRAVELFVIGRLNKVGIKYNKLGKVEQNFITGQVKAKIKNQPELFLPKAVQTALKKRRIKNLRQFTRARLEGKFDAPISYRIKKVGKKKKLIPKLTSTQKLALQRFSQRLEGDKLRKVVLKNLDKRLKDKLDILTPQQKKLIISQIKARIKADSKLTLTKTQNIALGKIKRLSELEKIKGLTKRRLKGEFEKPKLSARQKNLIEAKLKTLLKAQPRTFLPKQRKLALKRFKKLQEGRAIARAKKKGAKKLRTDDLLSKSDKIFIVEQIKAKAKTQPARFIPKGRQRLLLEHKPKVKAKKVPKFEIKVAELTSAQKLALNRFKKIKINVEKINAKQRQQLKVIQKTKRKIGKLKKKPREKAIPRGAVVGEPLLERLAGIRSLSEFAKKRGIVRTELEFQRLSPFQEGQVQLNFQQVKLKQSQVLIQKEIRKTGKIFEGLKQGQLLKQKELTTLRLKLRTLQKQRPRTKARLLFKQRQVSSTSQALREVQAELQRFRTLRGQLQRFGQRIKISPKEKVRQRRAKIRRLRLKRVRVKKKILKGLILKKRIMRKKKTKPQQVFDVFGKSRGKFVKLSRTPLTKTDALSKGAFAIDKTTARTFKIVPAGKAKKTGKLLKGERGYFRRTRKKLRAVKIRKGKKFAIKRKFIEKRKYAIDTKSEKKGLTIAKLLKQRRDSIHRKRIIKRKTHQTPLKKSRRKFPSKKRMSPVKRAQLLRNLKKARAVRMKNLRRKK